ncbi:hypothetical protein MMC13_007111 [Lambiella insularis]|nr:hypothetical protein [Lambiella insularis]
MNSLPMRLALIGPFQKKGPKGSRAKIISELRKTQELDLSQPSSSCNDGLPLVESPLASPVFLRTPGLVSADTVEICVSYFFENFYATMPVLNRAHIQQSLADMHSASASYCLIGSLCAFVVIQPDFHVQCNEDKQRTTSMRRVAAQCLRLVEETLRVWSSHDHKDNPTLTDVLIAFFLSAAYFGLEKANAAWIHLREAITLAQLLGMHDEATYHPGDVDADFRRRLFWLLYVSERGFALHKHRPLALHTTIEYPTITEGADDAVALTGLTCLCNLFRIIDDTFSRVWNTARSECSSTWLAGLQRQLDEALPADLKCPEAQEADLRITKQWLKIVIWQMSTASGCLSSTSTDDFLGFTYPIDVSKEVVAITSRLSRQALEVHGVGLIEKLFDVACTLIDVMSCVPIETATFEVGPKDYLAHFYHLISTLRQGESRFVALLEGKIRDTLPTIGSSFGLTLPTTSHDRIFTREESSRSSNSSPYSSPYHSPSLLSTMPRSNGLPVSHGLPISTTLTSIPIPTNLALHSIPDLAGSPVYSRVHFGDGESGVFS